jgi:hypothetical protein
MYNAMKQVIFALMILLAAPAFADEAEVNQPPAHMSDAELASYIAGQLQPVLESDGYTVTQDCVNSNCAVVIQ